MKHALMVIAIALAIFAMSSCNAAGLITPSFDFNVSASPSTVNPGGISEITSHFEWTDGMAHDDVDRVPLFRANSGTLYAIGQKPSASELNTTWLATHSDASGSEVLGGSYIYWVAPKDAGD